jgi:DNA uptake protein ComE-like DNA-binding protein
VVYRDGADGICGTADDRRFQSIEQVDAVKYIGSGALERLASHAHLHGWVVDESAPYGEFMGVDFTVREARSALALVNRESPEDLEITLGLGLDVVEALVELRPFADLADVAHVSEVGADDLERLKR